MLVLQSARGRWTHRLKFYIAYVSKRDKNVGILGRELRNEGYWDVGGEWGWGGENTVI